MDRLERVLLVTTCTDISNSQKHTDRLLLSDCCGSENNQNFLILCVCVCVLLLLYSKEQGNKIDLLQGCVDKLNVNNS